MKRKAIAWVAVLLLLCMTAPALGKGKPSYTLKLKGGTTLQNEADRAMTPHAADEAREAIPGESPVTGLPLKQGDRLAMLVQIDHGTGTLKQKGKTVKGVGLGNAAPWGIEQADVVYEDLLHIPSGQTRLCCLFYDSLPQSVGPVRSLRGGAILLREAWRGGMVYAASGMDRFDDPLVDCLHVLEGSGKGLAFELSNGALFAYARRVKGVKAPANYDVDLAGLRSLTDETAAVCSFRFADEPFDQTGYERAQTVALDWGAKTSVETFVYDAASQTYRHSVAGAPFVSYLSAEARANGGESAQLAFANVIVQRVSYALLGEAEWLPYPQLVGRGNADIFIGGRYIPASWERSSLDAPAVFYDEQGEEMRFARGKTFIAHFPAEAPVAYRAEP